MRVGRGAGRLSRGGLLLSASKPPSNFERFAAENHRSLEARTSGPYKHDSVTRSQESNGCVSGLEPLLT
jgi:hypothetical protein